MPAMLFENSLSLYQAFDNFHNTYLYQLEFYWLLLQPQCKLQIALKLYMLFAYVSFYVYRKRSHFAVMDDRLSFSHCRAKLFHGTLQYRIFFESIEVSR